jgi:hypothetical protein
MGNWSSSTTDGRLTSRAHNKQNDMAALTGLNQPLGPQQRQHQA